MTLYRIDDEKADEFYASFTGGLPDPLWLFIEDGALVEVEPVETRIICDECDGTGTRQGFIGSSGCSACDERGFVAAQVVVVEDTE